MSELRVSSIKNLSGQDLITAASLGLDQVDNTSDLDKPISTTTQAALDAIASVPDGGLVHQALKKLSGVDGDYGWVDSPRVYIQKGTTLAGGTRTLSRNGGAVEPSALAEIIGVTSGRSALLSVKAVARATSGLTKTFSIEAGVKNSTVLAQNATSTLEEVGTTSWTLVVQWDATLGGYKLVASGSATESVVWDSVVSVVEV